MRVGRAWPADIPRSVRLLGGGALVLSLGGSMMWPLVTLYVHDQLHQSLAAAGFVLMLMSLGAAGGQIGGGMLHDRFGGKTPLVAATAAASLIALLLTRLPAWWPYVALMGAFGLANGASRAPMNALVAALWPEGGRRAFNVLYIARNIGFAGGAALGGFAAERSFALAYAGAAAGFAAFALLMWLRLPRGAGGPALGRPLASSDPLPQAQRRARLRALVALSGGSVLSLAAYTQWSSTIAVYMTAAGLSLGAYGLLWTLNGVLVLALQPLANAVVRRLADRLDLQLALAAVLFGAAFAALLPSRGYVGFVAGMALLSAGEVLDRPARPAAMAALAPDGRQGVYQGLIGAIAGGGRMVGPLAGGLVYDAAGPLPLAYACIGAALAAGAAYGAYGRVLPHLAGGRERPPRAPTAEGAAGP